MRRSRAVTGRGSSFAFRIRHMAARIRNEKLRDSFPDTSALKPNVDDHEHGDVGNVSNTSGKAMKGSPVAPVVADGK
jgi:hypothetical protein